MEVGESFSTPPTPLSLIIIISLHSQSWTQTHLNHYVLSNRGIKLFIREFPRLHHLSIPILFHCSLFSSGRDGVAVATEAAIVNAEHPDHIQISSRNGKCDSGKLQKTELQHLTLSHSLHPLLVPLFLFIYWMGKTFVTRRSAPPTLLLFSSRLVDAARKQGSNTR